MRPNIHQFSPALQKQIRRQWNAEDTDRLSRRSAKLQKFKNPDTGIPTQNDNKTKVQKDNGGYGCKFCYAIEIKFYIHDHYRRDVPGMNETVLDCLVNAFKEVGYGPQDDNRFVMPKHSQEAFDCAKGEDRVVITITEIEK